MKEIITQLESLKRYDLAVDYNYALLDVQETEEIDGDWIKYEDLERIILQAKGNDK